MIKVCYSEQDTAAGPVLRLETAGHAGYAPAGQDIVCAGASTLMQALVYLLAGEENAETAAWDEPGGPRLAVSAAAPAAPWVSGAFELVKAGFVLLAERYPEHVRFADVSRRGEAAMLDLQLFAGDGGAAAAAGESAGAGEQSAPALSRAQAKQAKASGTLKTDKEAKTEQGERAPASPAPQKAAKTQQEAQPQRRPGQQTLPPLPPARQAAVRALHARWAAEEAMLRRSQPDFSLQRELQHPEMRRLMQLPGMRMQDAYRLAHYEDALRQTARAVEQGVLARVQQRAARPAENGAHPGGAAVSRPDVARMTRAQREALEKQALHGQQINL